MVPWEGPRPRGPQELAGTRRSLVSPRRHGGHREVCGVPPKAREGRRPRGPRQYRAQGTKPFPRCYHAKDGVLAVRKNTGAEDCAPPGRRSPPNERARRTVPLPRWFPGRDRVPAVRKNTGAEDCAPPGRRAPPNERARRTVPLPEWIGGRDGVLAVRKNTGAEDCAPPRRRAPSNERARRTVPLPEWIAGRDRVLAVRQNFISEHRRGRSARITLTNATRKPRPGKATGQLTRTGHGGPGCCGHTPIWRHNSPSAAAVCPNSLVANALCPVRGAL
jgi:hypothetical protein